MNKLISTAAAFLGAAALLIAATGAAVAQDINMRIASYAPEGDIIDQALVRFNAELMKRTDGKLGVTIFRSNSLGSIRESIELTKLGTIDFAVAGAPHVSRFAPAAGVVSFPYIWKDRATMLEILDSELGSRLAAAVEEQADGLKVLAWWATGFRHVTNNVRPIINPDDIKGLKLRTVPTPVQIAFWRKLGAIPTPMDWAEVMPALQQGVIDGQENPPSVVYPYRVFEFQKYYSLTAHSNEPTLLLMSKAKFSALTPDQQAAVVAAVDATTPYQRQIAEAYNSGIMKELVKVIKINEVPEATRAHFREVAASVYDEGLAALKSDDARAIVAAILKRGTQ